MSCNIISSSHASINGSCSVYGGSISSATFTPSLLNGQHRATVTVVGKSLSSPAQGDELDLSIGSLNLPMIIGSYTIANSAGSMTRLTLNLYDKSHQFLDNSFVMLKEEIDDALESRNIAILGRKKGPHPDIPSLENLGVITPASDTVFVDIRAFYSQYPFIGAVGKWEETVDALVQQSTGKTNWFWKNDPDGGKTLFQAYGHLIEGELPNGPYSFHGPLRAIISQICDMAGIVAYWDMARNKVVTSVIKVPVALDKTSCTVISTSSTEDFTVTRANGAAGSFTSSFPVNGEDMKRYLRASLINPILHVKKTCGSKEMVELDLENEDIKKAISAASNPAVYGMYVMQSILGKNDINANGGDLGQENIEYENTAEDAQSNQRLNFLVGIEQDPDCFVENGDSQVNNFLADYYINSDNEECSGKNLFAIKIKKDEKGGLAPLFEKAANGEDKEGGWNNKVNSDPFFKVGKWDKDTGSFSSGHVIIHENHTLRSIIDQNLKIDAEDDLLRNYLKVVFSIRNNLWVIRDQHNLKSYRANGKNYGYYINPPSGGINVTVKEGDFELMAVNPELSLYGCDKAQIKTWATFLYTMYYNEELGKFGFDCVEDFLKSTSVVDFIRALDHAGEFYEKVKEGETQQTNSLIALFNKKGRPIDDDALKEQPAQPQMYLLLSNKIANVSDDFYTLQEEGCFNQHSATGNVTRTGNLNRIVSTIGKLDGIYKGNGVKEKAPMKDIEYITNEGDAFPNIITKSEFKYNFGFITDEQIHGNISSADLKRKVDLHQKIWYDVNSPAAAISAGPSEIFISNGIEPPSNENTWKSSMSLGLSVNSADIAANLGIQQTYLADTLNETFKYSKINIPFMRQNLRDKLLANVGIEEDIAFSESVTYLLTEDEFPEIPSLAEGLDSLDIRSSNGKTELTVTAGNANILRSKAALKDLKAVNSHILNETVSLMPDVLNSAPNARIQNIAKGNL